MDRGEVEYCKAFLDALYQQAFVYEKDNDPLMCEQMLALVREASRELFHFDIWTAQLDRQMRDFSLSRPTR
jgi:hypothetical protein